MDKAMRLACYRILKALMRILYRKGIAFGEFTHWVKQAYVDVVEEELAHAGERPTTTRIAVITGLTRKDVAQLRQEHIESSAVPPRFNRVIRVVNGWMQNTLYTDSAGQVARLPFRGGEGSFEHLVQCYSGDMSCFAMLDEMKRVGLIHETEDGLLELLGQVYIPQDEAKLELLGTDVSLLVSTIDHNLTAESGERYYQRKVSYDNLPLEVLPEFRSFVQEDAQQLLLRFNAWLYQHDRDSNPEVQGTGRMQAGVGIYYFEQPSIAKAKGNVDED